MVHRVIGRLGADHAKTAHPARIVVRHQFLAPHRMDQRGLEPVRQGAQLGRGATAASTAHDRHAAGPVDPPRDFGDVALACREFGARPQRRDAEPGAISLCRQHILRKRELCDARAGIGGGDRLIYDPGACAAVEMGSV
jgi:hypothetical protein